MNLGDIWMMHFTVDLCEATKKKRLLTESTLTFQRAVELAVSMETASHEAHQLSRSLTVNAMSLSE